MEDDFVPNFTLKDQIGEIFNEESQISVFNDQLVISHNNYLNFWDIDVQKIDKQIGSQKKKIITSYCIFDDYYILGYNDGSINAFDIENNQVFGFRIGTKSIVSLHRNMEYLCIATSNGYMHKYDIISNRIIFSYQKQKYIKSLIYNNEVFINYSGKTIQIFNYNKKDPIKVFEIQNIIQDIQLIDNILVILVEKGNILFYDYLMNRFFENEIKIKTATKIFSHHNNLFVISKNKKINIFHLMHNNSLNNQDISDSCVNKDYTNILKFSEKGVIEVPIQDMIIIKSQIFIITSNAKVLVVNEQQEIKTFLNFHQKEILDINIHKKFVFSISEDKLIKWKLPDIDDDLNEGISKLELINTIKFEYKTNGMCLFNSMIVVYDHEKITFLSCSTLEENDKKEFKNATTIDSSLEYLAIGHNNEIVLLNRKHEIEEKIQEESDVVFVKFSETSNLLGVANLSNKINIYKVPNLDQKMSLYGHSLPVKFFDFSNDDKKLASCSADKLIKVWGIEFGECHKTLYENAENVKFMKHNKDLMLASSGNLLYYKKNEKIKTYKNFGLQIFDYNNDFLVAASKYEINLYQIDKLELVEESSSEYDNELEIEDQKFYDKLEHALEKCKENSDYSDLLDVIENIDHAEIDNMIKIMDNNSLIIFLQLLNEYSLQSIIEIKLFLSITQYHMVLITENELAYSVYSKIFKKIEFLRTLIKNNLNKELSHENKNI